MSYETYNDEIGYDSSKIDREVHKKIVHFALFHENDVI